MPNIKIVALILASLIIGASTGYGIQYFMTQPQLNKLTTDLTTADTRLANTTSTLVDKINEIDRLNIEATASAAKINTLNQQLADLRTQLTSDPNATNAKLNQQIFELQNSLNDTQNTVQSQSQVITDLESKNITIAAAGSAFVDDNGSDIPTNRTLTVKISWKQTGWTGTGYYTVTATQGNSDTGLVAGYIYVLDVYNLTDVSITGNQIDASGTVNPTDRASILLNQPVTITGTANNDGKAQDQVTVTWPTINSNATLIGRITIRP